MLVTTIKPFDLFSRYWLLFKNYGITLNQTRQTEKCELSACVLWPHLKILFFFWSTAYRKKQTIESKKPRIFFYKQVSTGSSCLTLFLVLFKVKVFDIGWINTSLWQNCFEDNDSLGKNVWWTLKIQL